MKKQVRESKAAQSISAYVILNKKGQHVATVQVHYGNSTVQVDVWNRYELTHQRKAGGYGYDKFTAALSGAIIDGNTIYDHCGQDDVSKELLKQYLKSDSANLQKKIKSLGLSFANYSSDTGKYKSLYYLSGLDRLTALGYKVIQAI